MNLSTQNPRLLHINDDEDELTKKVKDAEKLFGSRKKVIRWDLHSRSIILNRYLLYRKCSMVPINYNRFLESVSHLVGVRMVS